MNELKKVVFSIGPLRLFATNKVKNFQEIEDTVSWEKVEGMWSVYNFVELPGTHSDYSTFLKSVLAKAILPHDLILIDYDRMEEIG